MSTISVPRPLAPATRGFAAHLAAAGALIGALDGIFAVGVCLTRSATCTPMRTFQGVAYALLGPAAFDGGLTTALLGLAMHFAVAFTWAALYTATYRAWPALRRATAAWWGTLFVGLAAGAVVWLVMDLIVLPLTRAGQVPPASTLFVVELVGHMVLVGPVLACLIRADRRARAR